MSWPRLFASVLATTTGLAFWWALTEPLPVPPPLSLGVAAAILVCAGLLAGRGGVIAAPVALVFSLLVGSLISTQLHQAFRPQSEPISEFGLLALRLPELLVPIAFAALIGLLAGSVGERLVPTRPG